MYCNFTNYGSALQTYALHRFVNSLAPDRLRSVVIDYCPDVLRNADVLDPIGNMLDKDEGSKHMVRLSMPDIKENSIKFNSFYRKYYDISKCRYTSENFDSSLENEDLDGYICGSDTIWCIREFKGFDDGYYAQFPSMRDSHTVSYAASFGDVDFTADELEILRQRLQNYKAVSVRESAMIDFIRSNVSVPVQRSIDPTLLLKGADYDSITAPRQLDEPYVLLYVRRYNKSMEEYADRLARSLGCRVVEISLRAVNRDRHIMRYDAGVEEFLSLVKYSEHVVTNSFHGIIFALQEHKEFSAFIREQTNTKIGELLNILGLNDHKLVSGEEAQPGKIDHAAVEEIISAERAASADYLRTALEL